MDEQFFLDKALPLRRDADGALRVGRTRVAAFLVFSRLRTGDAVDEILAALPTLLRSDVERLAEFCSSSCAEVDAYLAIVEADSAPLINEGRKRQADLLSELHRRAEHAARVG